MAKSAGVPYKTVAAFRAANHDVYVRLHSIAHILGDTQVVEPGYWMVKRSEEDEALVGCPSGGLGAIVLDIAKSMRRSSQKLHEVIDDEQKLATEGDTKNANQDIPHRLVSAYSEAVYRQWLRLNALGYLIDKNSERIEFNRIKANQRRPNPGEGLGMLVLDVAGAMCRAARKLDKAIAADQALKCGIRDEARQNRGSP